MNTLPGWAKEIADLFKSGSVAQFLIHGNIFDIVPWKNKNGSSRMGVSEFLDEAMFSGYDIVLHYDRGRGIRPARGGEEWGDWITKIAGTENLTPAQMRDPGLAMELIDRFILRTLNLNAVQKNRTPPKIAVIIEFAEFVVPRGDPIQLSGAFSTNIVKVLGWANDPSILRANIVSVLITEGLHDLNDLIVENPHSAKVSIPLPDQAHIREYIDILIEEMFPDLASKSEVPVEMLAGRLTGLSRIGVSTVIAAALKTDKKITSAYLTKMKKDMIERECPGLLEFLESPFTLDQVSGHDAVKAWLREDARLLQLGRLNALPMGYLIAGRIGTGKTFIVQCWAGELGIPCVVLKNFRDKWVGATESNLEKIFSILRALGQVVVFVDEADQATGKRGGGDNDSGLSGRIYAMLAKEMSDTRNRGKIIWVFATSRPDLLEVDLKRQGRLDVHIPLFPPQNAKEVNDLLLVMAKKLKFPVTGDDLPPLPPGLVLGGNEIEGALMRAVRIWELSGEPRKPIRDVLAGVLGEIRPSPHSRILEYMDMIAVKECTDSRFLPEPYKSMSPEQVEQRIRQLREFV